MYGRPGCHLCEQAAEVIARVCADVGVEWVELFIDDAAALKNAAHERMRAAWTSDDAFPYESPDDVPFDQAVASLLADAVPITLPGARRSQLVVMSEQVERDDDSDSDDEDGDNDGDNDGDDDDDDGNDDENSEDKDSRTSD